MIEDIIPAQGRMRIPVAGGDVTVGPQSQEALCGPDHEVACHCCRDAAHDD